jgi:hypothetical protein
MQSFETSNSLDLSPLIKEKIKNKKKKIRKGKRKRKIGRKSMNIIYIIKFIY